MCSPRYKVSKNWMSNKQAGLETMKPFWKFPGIWIEKFPEGWIYTRILFSVILKLDLTDHCRCLTPCGPISRTPKRIRSERNCLQWPKRTMRSMKLKRWRGYDFIEEDTDLTWFDLKKPIWESPQPGHDGKTIHRWECRPWWVSIRQTFHQTWRKFLSG